MKSGLLLPLALLLAACTPKSGLTKAEKNIINRQDSLMHVLVVDNSKELKVLRAKSIDFTGADLQSPEFKALVAKMKHTVQDPSQDGVGIAGPQVGLNRRIIIVCRLDKPGWPFEAYANVAIDSLWGDVISGKEGCLSVPGRRGNVPRSMYALVSYVNPETLEMQKDTVVDYVARIFQHECDHLEGIVYTDRTKEVWPVEF